MWTLRTKELKEQFNFSELHADWTEVVEAEKHYSRDTLEEIMKDLTGYWFDGVYRNCGLLGLGLRANWGQSFTLTDLLWDAGRVDEDIQEILEAVNHPWIYGTGIGAYGDLVRIDIRWEV